MTMVKIITSNRCIYFERFSNLTTARTWLLVNDYLPDDQGAYRHLRNGNVATIIKEGSYD